MGNTIANSVRAYEWLQKNKHMWESLESLEFESLKPTLLAMKNDLYAGNYNLRDLWRAVGKKIKNLKADSKFFKETYHGQGKQKIPNLAHGPTIEVVPGNQSDKLVECNGR